MIYTDAPEDKEAFIQANRLGIILRAHQMRWEGLSSKPRQLRVVDKIRPGTIEASVWHSPVGADPTKPHSVPTQVLYSEALSAAESAKLIRDVIALEDSFEAASGGLPDWYKQSSQDLEVLL